MPTHLDGGRDLLCNTETYNVFIKGKKKGGGKGGSPMLKC